jgi:FXSXX-COOH protein
MDLSAAATGSAEVETSMVDLLGVDLADLARLAVVGGSGDDALSESLRRLRREAKDPNEALAGFQSSL